jgi:hypothetical protein
MMQRRLLTLGALVFMVGCDTHMHMHPYADYLQGAVGREDHDAIAKKMGAPHRTVALDKGGDLWTYDYCPQGSYLGSPTCQRLNLTFDKSGRLSEWSDK